MNCKLCKKDKVLKNSHIIPRFLYRYMLKVTGSKITQFDGKLNLWQKSNRQLKKHLLCSCCEQLLGDNETLFSEIFREINLDGNKSKYVYGELDSEQMKNIESRGFTREDIEKVLELNPLNGKILIVRYFAISYLYRELINNRYSIPEDVSEKIRNFLLGVGSLPFMLHVRLNDTPPIFNLLTTVIVMDGLTEWKHFVFYIPNMQFHIALHVDGASDFFDKTMIFPASFEKDEIGSLNLLRKFQDGSRFSKNL